MLPFSPAPDGKNTKASRLLAELREEIVSGALAPGTKINLARLRARLDVSLSPLREALARLMAEGLVEWRDNRGYWVSAVSLANLEDITRLRVDMESQALRQAILTADAAWEGAVMRALHALNRCERIAGEPRTLAQWEELHRAFHLTLIGGCASPILLRFCQTLLTLNDRYRRVLLRETSGDRDVAAEHGAIAQGAVARDADFACRRLAEHLSRTGANLRRRLAAEGGLARRC